MNFESNNNSNNNNNNNTKAAMSSSLNSILSITERQNELTNELDLLEPIEIFRLLRQADSQIFSGWRHHSGLFDEENLNCLEEFAQRIKFILTQNISKLDQVAIILSGSGTSGRLAFLLAHSFNKVLNAIGKPNFFHYLIAGGDRAIIKAQEISEDNPIVAVQDLKEISDTKSEIILITISCGLSAPYSAGQVEYGLQQSNFTTGLMGFSPVALARDAPVENWSKTFRQIALQLQQAIQSQATVSADQKKYFIINPIVGPEPLTGSTRMKGGSCTKILLEVLFARALCLTFPQDLHLNLSSSLNSSFICRSLLQQYETIYRETYFHASQVAPLIQMTGLTLNQGGHVYYLAEENSSFGLYGLLDASECPPTFGAKFDDVKCLLIGGWRALGKRNEDFTSKQEEHFYQFGIENFAPNKLDMVILLLSHSSSSLSKELTEAIEKTKNAGAYLGAISVGLQGQQNIQNFKGFDSIAIIDLPFLNLFPNQPCFSEMGLKWVLNAISTGAHVLKGKVYQNRMIDIRVSNNKLYYRAIRIISEIAGVSSEVAETNLLKAIYNTECLTEVIKTSAISARINQSADVMKIVPKAVLLSTNKFNLESATKALEEQPIVRKVLQSVLEKT